MINDTTPLFNPTPQRRDAFPLFLLVCMPLLFIGAVLFAVFAHPRAPDHNESLFV
jgi:hypothetical protein